VVPECPETYAGSVIIPTYNRATLLEKTLEALQQQTVDKEMFEVIVVDDGSSDNSKEVVRSFESRLNIRYFWQEDNGFRAAAARNVGISNARAPICIFLDSGVLAAPSFIEEHLKAHADSSGGMAVVGYVHSIGSRLVSMGRDEPQSVSVDRDESSSNEDGRERFFRACADDLAALASPWLLFWTCNVSVKKCHLQTAGMFDEAFRTWGVEDIELGYRLHRAGLQFSLNRRAAAVHLPHGISEDQRLSHLINFRYFMRKHGISAADAIRGPQAC